MSKFRFPFVGFMSYFLFHWVILIKFTAPLFAYIKFHRFDYACAPSQLPILSVLINRCTVRGLQNETKWNGTEIVSLVKVFKLLKRTIIALVILVGMLLFAVLVVLWAGIRHISYSHISFKVTLYLMMAFISKTIR